MQKDPTGRALRLLSLLQTQRFWSGAELAARLEVTERTVRRDIDRLRELDYPVDAVHGIYGGYRLAAGAHLPPLLFGDDEAVAVAIGLRYAAEAAIRGTEETSLRALTMIEMLLPHRLRRRVSALRASVAAARPMDDDLIDPEALSVLAAASRDHEHVRFDYRGGDGTSSVRVVEPHQLVTVGRRWYLVAWDRGREDWRTFRVDRMQHPRLVGGRFAPREIPGGAARLVADSVGASPRVYEGRLVIHASIDDLRNVLRFVDHTSIEQHDDRTVVLVRGEDLGRLAMTVARIAHAAPVTVVEPTQLAETVSDLARNLTGASS